MTLKFKTIVSGIITTAFLIIIFLYFRVGSVETDFVKSILNSSKKITLKYQKLLNQFNNRNLDINNYTDILNKLNKNISNTALIAITEPDYSIIITSKNDRFIKSGELYDTITNDISKSKFKLPTGKTYAISYYLNDNNEEQKYYIFNKLINRNRLLYIFPYVPGKKMLVKIGIEVFLIIIFSIILVSTIYILHRNNRIKSDTENNDLNETSHDEELNGNDLIDLKAKSRSIELSEKKISGNALNIAHDSLNNYVFNLFKNIYSKYLPESVSLYLKITDNKLSKSFEMNQKSFIKIDSTNFDTISLESEFGDELKKSAVILLDTGKIVFLPIISDNSLLGLIKIVRKNELLKNEINEIKHNLKSITKQMSDFLVVNNVMTDSDTGLYSKTYFLLKHNEQLAITERDNSNFSIIFISIIKNDIKISKIQRDYLIKFLSPHINELLKENYYLCRYDNLFGIIIPHISNDGALTIADNICKKLSKFKVKVDKNNIIMISPCIGISSSDNGKEDMINKAVKNLFNNKKIGQIE